MKQKCCVAIPVYKEKLNPVEEGVLRDAFEKLSDFPFQFIAPGNLDLKYYQETFRECGSLSFNEWQSDSISDYNRLMMQHTFYRAFEEYESILIFQLDGLLLKGNTELHSFLDMGYDYIGAPWPGEGYRYCKRVVPGSGHIPLLRKLQGETLCRVGNGGVSLRKVSSMIRFFEVWEPEAEVWGKAEDIFISFYGQKRKCELNIAPVKVARYFSLETNMKEEIENGNIPFAVHKWEQYYPELPEKAGLRI